MQSMVVGPDYGGGLAVGELVGLVAGQLADFSPQLSSEDEME